MVVVILSLHLVFVHVATVWIWLQWDLRLINKINKAQESPAGMWGLFVTAGGLSIVTYLVFLNNRKSIIFCFSNAITRKFLHFQTQ